MITLEMEYNCPHCERPSRKVVEAKKPQLFISITCPSCRKEYALKLSAKVLTPLQTITNEL